MASVLIFLISVISLFVTPVTCQMDIVSVKTIEDGTPFKITCNAQRVIATQGNFSSISSLQIYVLSNGAQDYSMVAQYVTLPLGDDPEVLEAPPGGRKWQFSFNGSNSANRGANNKATMKIEILVPDTTCADAGLYKCVMMYAFKGAIMTDSNIQNVTSTAKTTEPLIVLNPIYDAPTGMTNTSTYDLGANITVSCTFQGREELGMKWKREARPAFGVDIRFEDYPIMNDITTDTATREPGTSAVCPEYTHKSVLKLTISEEDDQRQYLCVVMLDNEEMASGAAYIIVGGAGTTTPSSGNVASASGKPDNIGLIVGLVVGIFVAIVIAVVIIVICCRRRSKGSNKNKHETDRPDGGHEQYVPPPVLYSRPNKGVNNNNNNNNDRDSKALDDDGRRELHNRQHDDASYKRKEGKPYKYNPSYGNDAYTHEHKQANGVSQHNKDDLHYASTDVSRSDDESVAQPVVLPGRNTSKPRNPPPVPRKREDNKSLNYIQLDLPPSKKEGPENAGNRNRTTSVEYAEISV